MFLGLYMRCISLWFFNLYFECTYLLLVFCSHTKLYFLVSVWIFILVFCSVLSHFIAFYVFVKGILFSVCKISEDCIICMCKIVPLNNSCSLLTLMLYPASFQWVSGALSLGVKLPGHEADHSPPSGAKVKNSWSYTSTPRYAFMARCSVKEQGS